MNACIALLFAVTGSTPGVGSFGTTARSSAGVPAYVTIDFDRYPGGASVPPGPSISNQWETLGVRFSDTSGNPVCAVNTDCSLSSPNHVAPCLPYNTPTIVATFVDRCTGLPAATDYVGTAQDTWWVQGEGIRMRVYDTNGMLLDSHFNSEGAGHFYAFSYPQAVIARIEMDTIGQGIDNFVFNLPSLCSRSIGCGSTEPGAIDAIGEIDAYSFSVSSPGAVSLTIANLAAIDPGFEACMELYVTVRRTPS